MTWLRPHGFRMLSHVRQRTPMAMCAGYTASIKQHG